MTTKRGDNPKRTVTGPIMKNRREIVTAGGVGVFTAVFLVFFRAVEMSANSLSYTLDAQTGTLADLFYAPHLAFSATVRVFATLLGSATTCNTICAGQVHAILWAVTAVVCMYVLVARLTKSETVALTAAASLLVSSGFWVFATQLEVYVPTVGALLLVTAILFFADKWPGWLYIASCAAIWAVATLFHQGTAMFALPLAAYLITKRGKQGAIVAALISVSAGVIVIIAYLGAYAVVEVERPFLAWLVGLATTDLVDWGSFGNGNLAGLKQALYSQVSSLIVMPGELRPSQYPLHWRGGLLILALLGWSLLQTVRRVAFAEVRLFFLAWFCAYFLFFTWWDPRVLKFFVPSGAALIALGAFALHDLTLAGRRLSEKWGSPKWVLNGLLGTAIPLSLAVVFMFNLVGSVLPLRGNLGPALGPHYQEARLLAALVPEECVVSSFGHQLLYLSYYAYGGSAQHKGRSSRIIFETYYDDVLSKEPPPSEPGRSQSLSDEQCVLINVSFLAERWFGWKTRPAVYPLSPSGESPDWRTFLDWYFRAVPDEDGQTITFDTFRLLTLEDRAYILVDRRQREQAPRDHIARTLEAYVEVHGNEFESSYAGRDRELIFGYGGNFNTAPPGVFWDTLVDFVKNSERTSPDGVTRRDN